MNNTLTTCLLSLLIIPGMTFAQHTVLESPAPSMVHEQIMESPCLDCGAETGCGDCGGQFWGSAEYLLGWVRSADVGPLATTSAPGTARQLAGVLGAASTTILSDDQVNDEVRSGLRFALGYQCGSEWDGLGVEVGAIYLESQSTIFAGSSDNFASGILARPFALANGAQSAVLVGFPGSSTGNLTASVSSDNFYEAHVSVTDTICRSCWGSLTSIVGYRFYRYDEGVRIEQNVLPTGPTFAAGTNILSVDNFGTQNEFHGLDLGLRGKVLLDNFTLGFLAKVALGNLQREVNVQGNQVVTVPGVAPVVNTGGVLALSSNIGRFERNQWKSFGELGADVGWRVSSHLTLSLGYSFLIMDSLSRASEQIDFTLNPNLFPPSTVTPTAQSRPSPQDIETNVYIQTISVKAEVTY